MSPHDPGTQHDLIPLVDLAWQHRVVADDVAAGWSDVIGATDFVGGTAIAEFEREFARFSAVAHCVGVANGTDALELALRASGVTTGDRVVLPANTFLATAEAVARIGAVPHLVDCEPVHGMLDPEQTVAALPGARAVVPVHLYGQIAPLELIVPAAVEHGCVVIEDAAHAHGATRTGRGASSWGRAAATSFYPSKNLGAYGDAGAVLTNDDELAAAISALRDHGAAQTRRRTVAGCNSRLDTLQAVVLRAKLTRLAAWNELRREAADRYGLLLADLAADGGIELPSVAEGNTHVWHLYVVRVSHRDDLVEDLRRAGIGAGVHYRVPLHREQAFGALPNASRSFPVAERLSQQIVSLPMFPGITSSQQERVTSAVADSLRTRR